MTPADYRAAGYSVALQTEQSVIDRAEADVAAAYIVPLLGTDYDATTAIVRDAIMGIAYLLMQLRTAQATRAGGKIKTVTQSLTPTYSDLLAQNAATCAMYLQRIDTEWWRKVSDICRIQFKSNFINI